MTAMLRTHRWHTLVVALAVMVTIAVAFLLPVTAERKTAPRQISLVTRNMAFYVDGDPAPNPVLRVKRGEEIIITVRNEDEGMTHDLAINAWGASTKALAGTSSDRLTLTVPSKAGAVDYVCRPHSAMMRGVLIVE